MHSIETINRIIALLFAICYFYQYIYVLVPYFKKYRIVPKKSGNAGKATIADADLNRKQNRYLCAQRGKNAWKLHQDFACAGLPGRNSRFCCGG